MARNALRIASEDEAVAAAHVDHRKIHNASAHGEEHEEGEPWLLSYADMVTLLMCFFILFFSMDKSKGGISDPERIKAKLESMIALELSNSTSATSSTSSSTSSVGAQAAKLRQQLKEDLKKLSQAAKVVFALTTPEPGVSDVTFLNADFYEPGQATLMPAGLAALAAVVPRLTALSPGATFEIQGHTDSTPPRRSSFASNWELSTARASAVARYLMEHGLSAKSIMVTGFGEHRPLVPERDSEGRVDIAAQRLNRRVVLRVRLPLSEANEQAPPATQPKATPGAPAP
jgi:chemotaxis protein MotB